MRRFFQRAGTIDLFWVYAVLSAILLLAPIRAGDLAGYDDALYAHIAKGVTLSGDWLNIRSNGDAALEHPPLLVWTEAALFRLFGFSDALAKLPSALAGLGTILLVYWLARKLLGDRFHAVLAMFVMATSIYFLKYAARAMTDVPCTFLFVSAVCAWTKIDENRRWYLITGVLTALALLSRGMIGFALPAIFALDLAVRRKRPDWRFAISGLAIAFLPLALWYAHVISANGPRFYGVHATWLRNEVYGDLTPAWRRYTGAPEYLWMITKSYLPWLPAMGVGVISVVRNRDRKLAVLVIWPAVVFVLCAAARSRVLRYMLPAYPAFAVLASVGLCLCIPAIYLRRALAVMTPVLAAGVLWIAAFPPVILHAADVRPIAAAETAVTPAGERVIFYDEGNPRFDVTNQLQWYGGRTLLILFAPADLVQALERPGQRTLVIDKAAFATYVRPHVAYRVIAVSGNLMCLQFGTADAHDN